MTVRWIKTEEAPEFEYALTVIQGKTRNHYSVTVATLPSRIARGCMTARSQRKIQFALISRYTSENHPGCQYHTMTLHSSLAAAQARAKAFRNRIHLLMRVDGIGVNVNVGTR